jgi:F-box protein 11
MKTSMPNKLLSGALVLAIVLGAHAGVRAAGKKGVSLNDLKPKPKPRPAARPAPPRAAPKPAVKPGPRSSAPSAKPSVAKTTPTLVVAQGGGTSYRTIGEALLKAPAGARVLVRTGTYRESLILRKPVEIMPASADDLVTVEGGDQPAIKMQGERATVRRLTLRMGPGVNASYAVDIPLGQLVLEDCSVSSGAKACVGVYGDRANPVLRNCRLQGERQGLQAFEGARALLEGCVLSKNGGLGAWISGARNVTLRGCRVAENGGIGLSFEQGSEGLVDNCDINGNGERGVSITTHANPTLRDCRIYQNKHTGIVSRDAGRGVLEGCDVLENGQAGLRITIEGSPVVRRCKFRANKQEGIEALAKGGGLIEDAEVVGNLAVAIAVRTGSELTVKRTRVMGEKPDAVQVTGNSRATFEGCELSKAPGSAALFSIQEASTARLTLCKLRGGMFGLWSATKSKPVLENCDVSGSSGIGVCLSEEATATMIACRVFDCQEEGIGLHTKATLSMEKCDVFANTLAGLRASTGGSVSATKCTFRDGQKEGINFDPDGSGLFVDCDIRGNLLAGVGIHFRSTPVLRQCRIVGGKGPSGAGVWCGDQGRGLFEDCIIQDNAFGALILRGGHPVFRRCKIMDNRGPGLLSSEGGRGIAEVSEIMRNSGGSVVMRDTARIEVRDCLTD